jgi:hypothetical protein
MVSELFVVRFLFNCWWVYTPVHKIGGYPELVHRDEEILDDQVQENVLIVPIRSGSYLYLRRLSPCCRRRPLGKGPKRERRRVVEEGLGAG